MKRSRRLSRTLFLLSALAILANTPLLAGNMPWYALGYRAESAGPYKVEVMVGLTYAEVDGQDQLADLYRPNNMVGLSPAVVVIHGGGWRHFDRQVTEGVCRLLASNGLVAVTVDYRLSKEASWPACLHDVKAAVRWVRANAKRFNVDPSKLGVLGDSAGGHLAGLVGTAGPDAGLEGDEGTAGVSSAVQAVVAYYGLYDLTAMPALTLEKGWIPQMIGGTYDACPELYKQASPMSYIDPGDPPFLLIHGVQDRMVSVEQSKMMEAALKAAGVPVTLLVVDNADHMLVKRGGKVDPALTAVDAQVVEFLRQWLMK